MLAGVLLPLCLAPVKAVAELPRAAVPIVLTWLVLGRFARPGVGGARRAGRRPRRRLADPARGRRRPRRPRWPGPRHGSRRAHRHRAAPVHRDDGVPERAGHGRAGGQRLPARAAPDPDATGLATVLGAPFGGHAVNLAAITAELAAGPEAHPDRDRRWIASVTGGVGLLSWASGPGWRTALILLSPAACWSRRWAGWRSSGRWAAALRSAFTESGGPGGGRRHVRGHRGGHRDPRASGRRSGGCSRAGRWRCCTGAGHPARRPAASRPPSRGEPAYLRGRTGPARRNLWDEAARSFTPGGFFCSKSGRPAWKVAPSAFRSSDDSGGSATSLHGTRERGTSRVGDRRDTLSRRGRGGPAAGRSPGRARGTRGTPPAGRRRRRARAGPRAKVSPFCRRRPPCSANQSTVSASSTSLQM